MTESIPVVLATSGLPGEAAIVAALDRPAGPTAVSRRCLDLADLLGAAATSPAQVAVVDVGLHRLDRDAVERLQAAGLGVVLLTTADGLTQAGALGADLVVATTGGDVEPVVAGAVSVAGRRGRTIHDTPAPDVRRIPARDAGPGSELAVAEVADSESMADRASRRGQLVAVWGPAGAPGRTSVALTLADEAARRGLRVWLVDADTTSPSVGQRLGLLEDQSGLVVAARLAGSGRLASGDVARLSVTLSSGLRLLTGLARPERWAELRPAALRGVWDQLGCLADLVVVDVGSGLERDDETLLDPGLPVRHGAALATLAVADHVVAVGGADPISLVRLSRGLDIVVGMAPGAERHVVVNRVRRSVVGDRPQVQLQQVIGHHTPHGALLVPDEPAAWDAALFAGLTLAEASPRCAGRGVLGELVDRVAAPPVIRRKARPARGRLKRHAAR